MNGPSVKCSHECLSRDHFLLDISGIPVSPRTRVPGACKGSRPNMTLYSNPVCFGRFPSAPLSLSHLILGAHQRQPPRPEWTWGLQPVVPQAEFQKAWETLPMIPSNRGVKVSSFRRAEP